VACDHTDIHLCKTHRRSMHPCWPCQQVRCRITNMTYVHHVSDRLGYPDRPDGQAVWDTWLLIYRPSRLVDMSAASCNTQLDHQTCRGSSIGRACGSYLIRYSQPQGRGFEPLLRLFLYSCCHSFWPFVLMPENSFLAHFKFLKFVEACQDFRGPTPHGLSCQASTFFFSLFSPLSHLSGYVLH
jgi:hypothetical protein